jgi:hypothetical protein
MRAKPDVDGHRRPQDDSVLPFKLRTGEGEERRYQE